MKERKLGSNEKILGTKKIGSIYKIVNTNNEKVYIGKTYTSIELRFKRHIDDSRKKNKHKVKLYRAMCKYGADTFSIEFIGKYEEGELEKQEILYIEKYDSYNNGYNATLGGDGGYIISQKEINGYISLYNKGYTIMDICKMYSRHAGHMRNIFEANGVEVPRHKESIYDPNEIVVDYADGMTIAEIARKNKLSNHIVSNVLVDKGIHLKAKILRAKHVYKNIETGKIGFIKDMLDILIEKNNIENPNVRKLSEKIRGCTRRKINNTFMGLTFIRVTEENLLNRVKIIPNDKYLDEFILPIKGSAGAACYDLIAYNCTELEGGNVLCYDLGFSYELPQGYHLEVYSRSSIYKTGLVLCNSVGILDWDYTGQAKAMFYRTKGCRPYEIGDRVCQMRLVKDEEFILVEQIGSDKDTVRGSGGFGSTGRN